MPQVGDVLSRRYEILSYVGSCPTRRTYLAFDRDVEVEVTLWWVPGYLFADEMARELFEHNIAAMRKIKSPHLLRLFDFAQLKEPDGFYITLQLGSSKGFEALLLSGVGAEDETFMRFARGLSTGIEAAYQQGFYHAWLSPADLVEVSGQVKVAGVGLFAGLQSSRVLRHWLEEVPSEELRYIAPEILAGGDGSPASDIYAMAAMLVDLSVGTDGKTRREADKELEEQAPERWRAIHGALSENTVGRPNSAAQFLASMELLWSGNVGESEAPQAAPVIIAVGTDFGVEESTETTLDDYIGGQKLLDDDDESGVYPNNPYSGNAGGDESPDDFFVSEVVTRAPAREKVEQARELDVDEGAEPDNDTIINLVAKPAVESHAPSPVQQQSRPAAQDELFSSFQERKSSGFLPLLVAALVAGAAAYLLSRSQADPEPLTSSSQEKTLDAGIATEDSALVVADPRPICPTSMLHLAEASLCIDAYESPGLGQLPAISISLEDARRACEARGVRLCLATEWESACRHKGNQSFGYGNRYRAEICNLQSDELGPAGGKGECHTDIGVYDLNGNAAEWVHEGEIRGGSALDGSTGRCSIARAKPQAAPSYSDVGFRCCADAIASP